MSTLTHGSDLRLAPTLRPIVQSLGLSPRSGLSKVAELGFASVQLDATMPGVRPRELDKSARRDLTLAVRRAGLSIAGLDFYIPPEHFHEEAHLDRAADAAQAACQLAADLGRVPLSCNLPTADADPALVDTLLSASDSLGVQMVIHNSVAAKALSSWLVDHATSSIGGGVDPAALLMNGFDPLAYAQSLGPQLISARLSDAKRGQADQGRVAVGTGDLDLMAYRVTTDLASARTGPIVLDLSALPNPVAAARQAKSAWENAAMQL